MKTSVLITVYNRPEMAAACLRALALSRAPVDEVVVSDDGSDEQCVRYLHAVFRELPFPVRYVRQEHNGYRLAAARNNAIRVASGDYLISLDCDLQYPRTWNGRSRACFWPAIARFWTRQPPAVF